MPHAVFNQKFGRALYDDALNAILPAAYEAAIAELGLDVIAQLKSDVNQLKKVKIGHLLQKLLQT